MGKKTNEIKFGTDGWRGIISDDFTFDNVRRVGAAIADYYNGQMVRQAHHPSNYPERSPGTGRRADGQRKIAVGYDTRFLSETYARIISEVLASKGIRVFLSDRAIPTPALSYAVKIKKLTAGVMITASHNPAIYNGIKIKTHSGGAAPVEVTRKIERMLKHNAQPIIPDSKLIITENLTRDYVKFLRSYINLSLLKKTKSRLLVDAMYGSGNSFIADVLGGTGVRLDFIRNQINPSFGGLRPEPVLENLGLTVAKLREKPYDLGLVLDGDADRIAGFAGNQEFIYPQKILGLLTLHLVRNRGMTGGVVKTVAGTTLIDKITNSLGLHLYETPVGFKYISELMENTDILVGGEEAGGIGFKGYIPERDGSLAGLLLLEMMAYRKKPILNILHEMEREFGRYYYLREDIRIRNFRFQSVSNLSSKLNRLKSKKQLLGKRIKQVKDFDGIKLICEDEGWLMLRASGTEPLVRVYAEARSLNRSKQLINFGKDFLSRYAL